jgi:replicative DNA helicase
VNESNSVAPQRVSSEILDRLPPQNLEAEKGVLGSVLLKPEVLDDVATILREEDFYAEANQRVYRHLLAIHDEGRRIDVLLLVERLKQHGDLEVVGGTAYIAELAASSPISSNARHYAESVIKYARRRAYIHAGTELLRDSWDPTANEDDILDAAESALSKIRTGQYQGGPVTAQQAAEAFVLKVDRACERKGEVGILTGLELFDTEAGGLFPGDLIILAARTSVGKTALALQIADHAAARNRLVYFASLEMVPADLAGRTICGIAGVSGLAARTGKLNKDELRALTKGAETYAKRAIRIDKRPGMKVYDIRRAARRLVKDGLRMVVVDYLQLLTPDNPRLQRYEQVGQQTKALKELALELDVPLLCLCQLNRAAEQQDYPTLANLRESGSIEQDADMVMLLHRPAGGIEIPVPGSKRKERAAWPAELILAKYRHGDTFTVRLDWDPRFTRFSCWNDFPLEGAAGQPF